MTSRSICTYVCLSICSPAPSTQLCTHHLHHLHLSTDPEVVQEHLQVLLHLDAVIVHLGYSEDAHPALPPHLGKRGDISAGTQARPHPPQWCPCSLAVGLWPYGRHLVLAQQEGQKHEHASIVHDPPHINIPIAEALLVLWE